METNYQIPLPSDSQLQHYKIIKVLGRGGFGISYLALDTQRNRPVVIKEYFPEHAAVRTQTQTQVSLQSTNKQNDFQEGLRRFEREAMVLSEFTHPNIVKVEAFFKDNNTAYFVMEFIDGESLQDTLDKKGSAYTEEELLNDVFPILEGLKEVHKKGMLHLDIKPDNILKTKYGQPVLIDFGGARFSTGQASQDHSSMVATAGYAPPEQYSLSQEQTPATDIYAFGMTLYQLMAPKEALPDSKDRQNALLEDLPDPLKPIRQVAPDYSDAIYKVVEACTRIKKKDRPVSITTIDTFLWELKSEGCSNTTGITGLNEPTLDDVNVIQKEGSIEGKKAAHRTSVLQKMLSLKFAGVLLTLIILVSVLFFNEELNIVYKQFKWEQKLEHDAHNMSGSALLKEANSYFTRGYRKDFKKAFDYYQLSADKGNDWGAFGTAWMLHFGIGIEQDFQRAKKIYENLASQKFAPAQTNLGYMYRYGHGVEKSYEVAFNWYQLSAKQGRASGQTELGAMYELGKGVKRDYKLAEEYYIKAADQEYASAYMSLGNMFMGLKADEWFKKADSNGLLVAKYVLLERYRSGVSIAKDDETLNRLSKEIAEEKDIFEILGLAESLENGYFVDQNIPEAIKWYKKLSERGVAHGSQKVQELQADSN